MLEEYEGCYLCGEGEGLEGHHRNWDHRDNRAENKMRLCRRCHVWVHQVGYLTPAQMRWVRLRVKRRRAGEALAIRGNRDRTDRMAQRALQGGQAREGVL